MGPLSLPGFVKLLLDVSIIVETFLRKAQPVGLGVIRPAGVLIRAAIWARTGALRDHGSALGTNVGRHGPYPIPAYSSSVRRSNPITM